MDLDLLSSRVWTWPWTSLQQNFLGSQDTWIDVCSLIGWPIWGISHSEGSIWNNSQTGHRCPWSRLSPTDLPGTPVFQRVTSKSKAWNPQLWGAWGVGRLLRWGVGQRLNWHIKRGLGLKEKEKPLSGLESKFVARLTAWRAWCCPWSNATGKGDRRNNLQWVPVMHQGLLYRLDLISEAASLIPFAYE